MVVRTAFLQLSLWQQLEINSPNSNVGRSRRAVAGSSIGTIPLEMRSSYVISVTNMIAFVINRCDFSFTLCSCRKQCFRLIKCSL